MSNLAKNAAIISLPSYNLTNLVLHMKTHSTERLCRCCTYHTTILWNEHFLTENHVQMSNIVNKNGSERVNFLSLSVTPVYFLLRTKFLMLQYICSIFELLSWDCSDTNQCEYWCHTSRKVIWYWVQSAIILILLQSKVATVS